LHSVLFSLDTIIVLPYLLTSIQCSSVAVRIPFHKTIISRDELSAALPKVPALHRTLESQFRSSVTIVAVVTFDWRDTVRAGAELTSQFFIFSNAKSCRSCRRNGGTTRESASSNQIRSDSKYHDTLLSSLSLSLLSSVIIILSSWRADK